MTQFVSNHVAKHHCKVPTGLAGQRLDPRIHDGRHASAGHSEAKGVGGWRVGPPLARAGHQSDGVEGPDQRDLSSWVVERVLPAVNRVCVEPRDLDVEAVEDSPHGLPDTGDDLGRNADSVMDGYVDAKRLGAVGRRLGEQNTYAGRDGELCDCLELGSHGFRLLKGQNDPSRRKAESGGENCQPVLAASLGVTADKTRTVAIMVEPQTVTRLLKAWGRGDQAVVEQLYGLVNAELRQLARRQMAREPAGHTLQATALINEAYLRLAANPRVRWQNRAHFFALTATLMRHVLVDHARAKRNLKRGAGFQRVSLSAALNRSAPPVPGVVELDDALDALAAIDPRRSRVVELRFFGGLTVEETSAVLNISPETVMRDWKLARVWLRRELQKAERCAT
jgi:RNA polymerase sigma factor (TIGR02999 family)